MQPPPEEIPPEAHQTIRWMIWLYFALLIFEGALRKWVVPQLSNPLLIVRDPLVLAIYGLAWFRGVFPRSPFLTSLGVLAGLTFLASFFTLFADVRVAIWGVRCNFLHLPLIFVIGRVFTFEDVRRMGFWILLLAIPMTVIMVAQFQSPPDAWINRGAGEESGQLSLIAGRVRPSGTFSFVSGIIYYFGLVTAFLIHGLVQRRAYPIWLTVGAGLSLPAALAVSGSRSTLALCLLVAALYLFGLILKPSLLMKSGKLLLLVFIAASVAGGMTIFREGVEVFNQRIEHAASVEGGIAGFFLRFIHQFTEPLSYAFHEPLLGYGLGSGTNVGAKLLTGSGEFLLAEEEWARVILESGAILGGLYLFMRLLLAATLGASAFRAARAGHVLPLLLFGVSGLLIVNGQFGQSTMLGFACLAGGLTIGAMRSAQVAAPAAQRKSRAPLPPKVRAYWEAIQAKKRAARRPVFCHSTTVKDGPGPHVAAGRRRKP